MYKLLVAAFVAAWLTCTLPLPARAQQAGSSQQRLTLTPAIMMLHAKPGQTVTQTVTLSNQTERGLSFEMDAQDEIVKNGVRVTFRGGELSHSIAGSAVFSQRSGYIAPFTDKSITVLLTVPPETNVRAVVITFKTKNGNAAVAKNAVGLLASLGALVTFVLTDDFSLLGGPVRVHPATASENLKVTQQLANAGSEPLVPEGVAAFIDGSGALAAKVPFGTPRLLPGERAEFTASYPGRLRPGTYRVICTFSYEGRALTTTGEYRAP
jgi:hypothetical protein